MPITQTILDVARTDPSRVAIADARRRITYGELLAGSSATYAGITALLAALDDETLDSGAAKIETPINIGDIPVVAISLTDVVEAARLVAELAGYRIITSVVDPLWPNTHKIRSIRRAGAKVVITDDHDFVSALGEDLWPGSVVTPERVQELGAQAGGVQVAPSVRADEEPFLLIFTSGTTDLPKGFLRTRHSWRYNAQISVDYLRCVPERRTIAPGPLSYSLTLYALIEVLATGGSLYLQGQFDPIAAVRLIDEHKIERYVAVPATLRALVAAARHSGSAIESLQHVIVGGANLNTSLRTEFETYVPHADLISYYGAAEIGFIGWSDEGDGATLEPFDGVKLSIRNAAGQECAERELGTLYVSVPSQGDRYISTTGGAVITDEQGWSTVDDQAYLDGGRLVLAGRAGDIVVTGGHNVSLAQTQRALEDLPGCEQCSVVALPDVTLGSVLAAVVEGTEQSIPSKRIMLEHLRETLPPQYVPHRFYRAEELPRTVGGKIRRSEVREQLEAGKYVRL